MYVMINIKCYVMCVSKFDKECKDIKNLINDLYTCNTKKQLTFKNN